MSWLEGRLPKWGPFGEGSSAVLEREETPEPEVVPGNNGPRLMVLVNDAAGFACFKTHTFPDAQAATDFLLYWFRLDTEGFTAFWAMTEEPMPAQGGLSRAIAEPLVMIKDEQRVDVVYSFSFVDIESAQAFIQDEIKNGADPAQITLYWAVPVRLESDALGNSILTPSAPPGVVVEGETEAETADVSAAQEEPTVEPVVEPDLAAEARRVLQEAPNANTGVANGMSVGQETFELTSWIERMRRKPEARVEDAALEDEVVESVVEEVLVEAPAVESVDGPPTLEFEDPTELDERQDGRIEASAADSEPDVKAVSPPLQTEADRRMGEFNEQYDGSNNGFITLEPVDIVVHTNGHSKVEPAEPPSEVTESPEATIETGPEVDGDLDQALDIRIDIQLGSSRAMKVKRWGIQENPFKGFKSPRGRF